MWGTPGVVLASATRASAARTVRSQEAAVERDHHVTTPPTPKTAVMPWPPAGPRLLREYGKARDFRRHAAHLAGSGWHPLTVTHRPASRLVRIIDGLTLGLFSRVTGAEPLLLVTYGPR